MCYYPVSRLDFVTLIADSHAKKVAASNVRNRTQITSRVQKGAYEMRREVDLRPIESRLMFRTRWQKEL